MPNLFRKRIYQSTPILFLNLVPANVQVRLKQLRIIYKPPPMERVSAYLFADFGIHEAVSDQVSPLPVPIGQLT